MQTSNAARYAVRLSIQQMFEVSSASAGVDKAVSRSAAMMAAFGIALSSFSLKQMLNSSSQTARKAI